MGSITRTRLFSAGMLVAVSAALLIVRCSPAPVTPVSDGATADGCVTTAAAADCVDQWCRIPAGCDVVGTPTDEFGHGVNGEPLTQVTLTHPYWMMQYEVVHAQVAGQGFKVVAIPNADCTGCADLSLHYWDALRFANAVSRANGWEECYEVSDCAPQLPDAGYDTTVCKVHSKTTNLYECRGARLPTEIEWEHAARAGTRTAFYGGDIATQPDTACHPDPVADQIGWYCANSNDRLQEPGLKKPNAWGLYDMSGNAPEVVGEGWDTNWYRRMPSVDPWELDTPEFDLVVARGGSSVAAAFTLRSGSRLGNPSWSRVGLRLVRTIFSGDEARPKLATGSVDPGLFTDGGAK